MIDAIYDYGRSIAVFMVFTVLCEIMMPKNRYREYIRLICGIFLTMLMLKPIGKIAETNINDFIIAADRKTMAAENKYYTEKQREKITVKFNEAMKRQINDLIGDDSGIENVEVKMNEEMSEITEIRIKIGNSEESVEAAAAQNRGINEKIIKNKISDFYNLSEDNIYLSTGN